MTRNQKYEQKQKSKGFKKITLWIPNDSEIEIKQMIDFLIENPDHIPYMARSVKTGRMKKAV
jgi:hypothetical protein